MTSPLPELNVPTGASRFNDPSGNGFAKWFGDIKQGVDVLGVEILNRAKTQVAETIGDMDIVQAGDSRILEVNSEADVSFAVLDMDGRRTWIEAGLDGAPTANAAAHIGKSPAVTAALGKGLGFEDSDPSATDLALAFVDKNGRRLELELGADGKVTDRVMKAWAARLGAGPAAGGSVVPDFPTLDWAHFGDSLTAADWPARLALLTGRSHYNGGWGGQSDTQIAARQGGVPALVTVAGNIIPANGPVAVTAIAGSPLSNPGSRPGTLAGIAGILSSDASGAHTFTRSTSGAATASPAKTMFMPTDGSTRRDRIQTLWAGRNSFKTEPAEAIVQRMAAMVDYLTPHVKRVVVMEIPPWEGEPLGSGVRATLDATNAALKAAFPAYWLPIAAWLRTPAAASAAGITFTADDNADIANGYTPRSLRSDAGHLNAAGNTAVAYRVHQEAQKRNWI